MSCLFQRQRPLAAPTEKSHTQIGPRRTITCIPILDDDGATEVQDDKIVVVRPNDPLYLMTGTSCPEDFGSGPMFVELDGSPFVVPVTYRGQEYQVYVRASYARPHVRDSLAPGADWPDEWKGKDAGHAPIGANLFSQRDRRILACGCMTRRAGTVDEDWDVLLSFLPQDWRELAQDTGALKGLRKDKTVDNLLRTLLLHLGCGHSLRETVVRARQAHLADLSDVALLKRLKKSKGWLVAVGNRVAPVPPLRSVRAR